MWGSSSKLSIFENMIMLWQHFYIDKLHKVLVKTLVMPWKILNPRLLACVFYFHFFFIPYNLPFVIRVTFWRYDLSFKSKILKQKTNLNSTCVWFGQQWACKVFIEIFGNWPTFHVRLPHGKFKTFVLYEDVGYMSVEVLY